MSGDFQEPWVRMLSPRAAQTASTSPCGAIVALLWGAQQLAMLRGLTSVKERERPIFLRVFHQLPSFSPIATGKDLLHQELGSGRSVGQDRSGEGMGSPGRTCQDQSKTHFERQPPMPKWGK